jgi:hypothetical protein
MFGPWGRDAPNAIREHPGAGEVAQATEEQARLEAIHTLYQRLAPAYGAGAGVPLAPRLSWEPQATSN